MEYPQPPGGAFHAPPPPTVPLRPSVPPAAMHAAAALTPSAADSKRKRQGNHLVHGVVLATAPPSSNAVVLPPIAVADSRPGASFAPSGARVKSQSKGPRKKATTARGRAPPPHPPAGHVLPNPVHSTNAYNVFDETSGRHNIHSSYTEMLEENAVDLSAPLDEFDSANQAEVEAEVDQGDDGVDKVEKLEEEEFDASQAKLGKRSGNYTEVEDVCLIRAWEIVSLDVVTGKDQSSKKYWQRIEDKYHKILSFPSGRSLKSI